MTLSNVINFICNNEEFKSGIERVIVQVHREPKFDHYNVIISEEMTLDDAIYLFGEYKVFRIETYVKKDHAFLRMMISKVEDNS